MAITVLLAAVLGATALVTPVKGSSCCVCGPVIDVELQLENYHVEPYFNHSVSIHMEQRQLLYFLQAAADKQEAFKFSAKYYPSPLGYFITTINSLKAADGSNWMITDQYNNFLTQGVSSYVPYNTEVIIFKYIKTDFK